MTCELLISHFRHGPASFSLTSLYFRCVTAIFGPKDSAFDAIADTLDTLTPDQISGVSLLGFVGSCLPN